MMNNGEKWKEKMALNCDILCHLMQPFIYTSCVRESVAVLSMHVSSFIVTQLIYGLHYAAAAATAAAHIKYLKTIILLSWAKGSAGERWKTKNEQRRIELGSRHFINLNDANCIFILIYVVVSVWNRVCLCTVHTPSFEVYWLSNVSLFWLGWDSCRESTGCAAHYRVIWVDNRRPYIS